METQGNGVYDDLSLETIHQIKEIKEDEKNVDKKKADKDVKPPLSR